MSTSSDRKLPPPIAITGESHAFQNAVSSRLPLHGCPHALERSTDRVGENGRPGRIAHEAPQNLHGPPKIRDVVDPERQRGNAGGVQSRCGIAIGVARVQHHEVRTDAEHRLDVRRYRAAEVLHRLCWQRVKIEVRPADEPVPAPSAKNSSVVAGLSETMRRGGARSDSVSPKSSRMTRAPVLAVATLVSATAGVRGRASPHATTSAARATHAPKPINDER